MLSFLRKLKSKEKEIRILLIGLDGSGKTSTMKKIKGGNVEEISSTKGFNIETLEIGNVKLNVWDLGGQKYLRPYWRNYFEETEGVVWVVDSSDEKRLDEGVTELQKVLKTEKLQGASLLLLANKQDIPNALSVEEIAKGMKLSKIIENRQWHIEASSAMTGMGIKEGFTWIAQDICSRVYTFD